MCGGGGGGCIWKEPWTRCFDENLGSTLRHLGEESTSTPPAACGRQYFDDAANSPHGAGNSTERQSRLKLIIPVNAWELSLNREGDSVIIKDQSGSRLNIRKQA